MSKFISQLFSDSGNVSMTRLLSLMCCINATVIAMWGIAKGTNLSDLSMLCGTFLACGMGAKVSQKWIETNKNSN